MATPNEIMNKPIESKRKKDQPFLPPHTEQDDASMALILQLQEEERQAEEKRRIERKVKEDADLALFLSENPAYLNQLNAAAPKKSPSPEPKKPNAKDQDFEAALQASKLEEEEKAKRKAEQESAFAKQLEEIQRLSLEAQHAQIKNLQNSLPSAPVYNQVQHSLETKMDADEVLAKEFEAEERRKARAISADRAEMLTQQMLATEQYIENEKRKQQESEDQALVSLHIEEQSQGTDILPEQLAQFYTERKACLEKISAENLKNMRQALLNILPSEALTGQYQKGKETKVVMDAHAHTKTDIKREIPILVDMDQNILKLSDPNKTLETVQAEVLKYMKDHNDAKTAGEMEKNINETFRRIRAAAADPKSVDAETGAMVHQFLSRTWSLATKLGRARQGIVASILSDNTGPNDASKQLGGCVPGLIARLYGAYPKFIATYLDLIAIVNTPEAVYAEAFNDAINGQSNAPAKK